MSEQKAFEVRMHREDDVTLRLWAEDETEAEEKGRLWLAGHKSTTLTVYQMSTNTTEQWSVDNAPGVGS